MAFIITSSAFKEAELIPEKYTCDGEDISIPLAWSGAPSGTQSYVMILDDPDAPMGTYDHWLLFNIPADVQELPENIDRLPAGTEEGQNSWGRTGYGGPCPPDKIHRYYFKLYALDTKLALPKGVTKALLLQAMQGHILAETQLMGRYDRPRK